MDEPGLERPAAGPRLAEATELHLFDRSRRGRPWTELIAPDQFVLFVRYLSNSMPCGVDGTPQHGPTDYTCVVFDSVEAAEQFASVLVAQHPECCCDLFDSDGRLHPPLLTVTHPDYAELLDGSARASRHRRVTIVVLLLLIGPLLWIDLERDFAMVLPTFLALTCAIAAVRFFLWDYGVYAQERERQHRLNAHRRRIPS